MRATYRWGMSLLAAAALAAVAFSVSAQQPAPAPGAATAPAATPVAPAAKSPGAAKVVQKKKPMSACQGLAEAACKAKSDCAFTAGYTTKAGKAVAGYCHAKRSAPPAAAPKSPTPPPPPK